MISYSTNWMGPINMEWFRERGLTRRVTTTVTEDSVLVELDRKNVGDVLGYDEITEYYSAGRIDIYGVSGEHYPLEYGVAPMHGEDWNALSDWLDDLETDELMSYGDLIESFQLWYGKSIRWADDIWYKCYECGLVTDLRETKDHIHKIDCTRG
jgi:hypothetical protein